MFRICRYYPGGHFNPHYDGFFELSPNDRSMKTIMVYLNDIDEDEDFQMLNDLSTEGKDSNGAGGATNFLNEELYG